MPQCLSKCLVLNDRGNSLLHAYTKPEAVFIEFSLIDEVESARVLNFIDMLKTLCKINNVPLSLKAYDSGFVG